MRRRLLLGLGALIVLLVGGASAYWYVAARAVAEATQAWIAARRAEGWTVSTSGETLSGWPRTAGVDLAGFGIAGGEPDIPGGVSWRADHLVVRLDLLHPDHADALARGVQRIGPARGASVAYTTALTRLRVPLHAPSPTAELTMQALRTGPDGLSIGSVRARIVAALAAGKTQAALRLSLDARDIVLPARGEWPLGRRVASVSAEAAIDGPIPPPRGLTADLRAWRDGGGAIEVRQIELQWGPLDGGLSGTAALDQALQPIASGEARASNYARTLDTLAERRFIAKDAALAAKAVLSLLASVPAAGPAQVEVPFTIRDRVVAVRGIPLVKLPLVQWPSS